MRNTLKVLSAFAVLWICVNAHSALVKRVAPFEGQIFEGFENVADANALTNLMGGLASFTGPDNTGLTVQDGNFANLWDQHAFEEQFFLGGSAGRGSPATIEITFAYPVNAFGGSFGHRVHPLFDTSQETEFVFYDANDKEIGRDKILVGSLPGGVSAHWRFTRGVKRITFTGIAPMADALTARLSAVSYRRINRSLAKAASAP